MQRAGRQQGVPAGAGAPVPGAGRAGRVLRRAGPAGQKHHLHARRADDHGPDRRPRRGLSDRHARPGECRPNVGGPGSPNGSSFLPQGGLQQPIRSIEYQHGYVCLIGAAGAHDPQGRPCSAPGYVAPHLAATETQVRAPVSARLLSSRPKQNGAASEEVVQISFTARVGISRSGEYYDASLTSPCTHAGAGVRPPNDIPAGTRVTIRFPLSPSGVGGAPCSGTYRGTVRLVAEPYYLDEQSGLSARSPALTVSAFAIRVP